MELLLGDKHGAAEVLAHLLRRDPDLRRDVERALAEADTAREPDEPRSLDALVRVGGNRRCADCTADDPTWASKNLGIFLCTQCAGVHRSLGVHISQVASCKLDKWSEDEVRIMADAGNDEANSFWEYHVPEGTVKPHALDPREERDAYIRRKYDEKAFTPKLPLPPATRRQPLDLREAGRVLHHAATERETSAGGGFLRLSMGHAGGKHPARSPSPVPDVHASNAAHIEYIGYVNINLKRAANLLELTVGQVESSLSGLMRTYVKLTLGLQTVSSKVVQMGTSPVWDEELLLCWDGADELVVEVYTDDAEHLGTGHFSLGYLLEKRDGSRGTDGGDAGEPSEDVFVDADEGEGREDNGKGGGQGNGDSGAELGSSKAPDLAQAETPAGAADASEAATAVQEEMLCGEAEKMIMLHGRDDSTTRSSGLSAARATVRRLARGSFFAPRAAQGYVVIEASLTVIDH